LTSKLAESAENLVEEVIGEFIRNLEKPNSELDGHESGILKGSMD
jgi:hypothetical protein